MAPTFSLLRNYGLIAAWQADLKDLIKPITALLPGLSQRVDDAGISIKSLHTSYLQLYHPLLRCHFILFFLDEVHT